ncbi:hypothetical protein [Halobaculum sp. D14]|uniref:hypothetical protein n=1 Tax=Halobaculum sp. D14 TaxID=3421642 RepID=UPI003EBFAF25
MRFTNIILAYLIIGAVMWAGGAVAYGQSGVNQFFIQEDDGQLSPGEQPAQEVSGVGNTIKNVIASFGGPLVLIWNLVTGLLTWLNWPITVLLAVNAPPKVVVLLGGPMTASFYLSTIRVVRSSA